MNIGFRVDGSTVIGTGHVMRCLTLAATLRDAGAACVFVCRDHPGNLAGRIRAEGHEAVLLAVGPGDVGETPARPGDHASWVGESWERDAAQTVAALGAHRPSWIVVDHYGLDARWEALVAAGLGARILAIDGQADRPHDCDALLDQTYSPRGAARWDGLVPARCRVFAGPGYSLLRPEFEAARATLRERDGVVRRLLVAFGGVDVPGATGIALEAVARGRPRPHRPRRCAADSPPLGSSRPPVAGCRRNQSPPNRQSACKPVVSASGSFAQFLRAFKI